MRRRLLGTCALALGLLSLTPDAHATISAGDLVIREFRLRGPSSATNEYIVIYNQTASDITIAASDASAGFGMASSDGNLIFTIPNGTVIMAHSHYLGVNTNGFSLGVPYDNSWTADIGDGLGLALFDSNDPTAFDRTARAIDAVGIGNSSAPYLEGTALTSLTTPGEYAWIRKAPGGITQDTDSSATDFVLVATDGAVYNTVQSVLGAPSPASSANHDLLSRVDVLLVEPNVGEGASPNFEAIPTPFNRLEFRRRITNNTGVSIPALRFRFLEVSTLNSPGYSSPTQADLRPNTSGTVSFSQTSTGATSASGLNLLTPPAQPLGGGWNSVLTLPGGPLADRASVDVNIALRISRPGTYTFLVTPETVAGVPVSAPVMSPPAAAYGEPQTVSLSTATIGASVYYTTDGSTPTTGSTLYNGEGVSVTQSTTIRAIAVLTNWADSPVTSGTYTLYAAAPPTITPNGSAFQGAQTITLTSATPSPMAIWYTLDGSTPAASSPSFLYAGAFSVSSPVTVKAIAFKGGWDPSTMTSAVFVPTVATPVFSPPAAEYTTSQAVSISAATAGATIRYTTNGDAPTPASAAYGGPVTLTVNTTLRAAAFLSGWADSAIVTGGYAIRVADPVLSPAVGKWHTQHTVQVTTATPGATIHFTTDGTEPTSSSAAISGGQLLIDRSLALKVRAFKAGAQPSGTVHGRYLITGQLAGGQYHSMSLKANGEVWGWGGNYSGQVGDGGAFTARTSPVLVLSGVIEIAVGTTHSVALKADGSVWTWGDATSGKLGRVTPPAVPGQVDLGGSSAIAIAAGTSHTLAVLSNGQVRSWGANGSGQLGRGAGNITSSTTPVPVVTSTGPLSGVIAVAAGASHSLALRSDGTLLAWGGNASGALGDGTTTTRTVATLISTITDAKSVSTMTDSSFAVVGSSNELKGWGLNNANQLGDGTTTNRLSPVLLSTGVTSVAAGGTHSASGDWDARVWGFGRNVERQLGDATALNRSLPVRSRMSRQVLALGQGLNHSLSADTTGSVWATGHSTFGQLGLGNSTSPFLPTALPSFSLVDGTNLSADIDNDGLSFFDEFLAGTDPLNPDTNANGMLDGAERALGLGGALLDSDGDGLSNDAEILAGIDPFAADSDGDGSADGVDQFPLDPSKNALTPTPGDTTPPVITLLKPTGAVIIP